MKVPKIPNIRKSSIFVTNNMKNSQKKLEGIDRDIIPAHMQNTEMYDASEIEPNDLAPPLKFIDKLCCK